MEFHRREFLAAAALTIAAQRSGRAEVIEGRILGGRGRKPAAAGGNGPVGLLHAGEAETVEAIADRMIPPDPETPGGKDAGCADYIDNQLAGPYGSSEGLYTQGPSKKARRSRGRNPPLTRRPFTGWAWPTSTITARANMAASRSPSSPMRRRTRF